jgi:hypothetical protein
VLAGERGWRDFQSRLSAAILIYERKLPTCFSRFSQRNSDGALLAQIGHRQLTLLASEMLIRAGSKPLIVAVEMVNYNGVLKEELGRAGTTDEDNHRCQQCDGRRLHGSLSY